MHTFRKEKFRNLFRRDADCQLHLVVYMQVIGQDLQDMTHIIPIKTGYKPWEKGTFLFTSILYALH